MVSPQVCSDEEKKRKDKRPQSAEELTNCNLDGSGGFVQRPPEKPRPSTVSKRLRPTHRDKESLLDELLELKNAVVEQAYHMKLHIQQTEQVQEENDRLEKSVENLELAYGLEAPRVGGENKLTSKLLGLKARLREQQTLCNYHEIEIGLLKKDIRVTHCRELEIERDLFATEVGAIQKTMRELRRLFVCVNRENDEIQTTRQKIEKLESSNIELKSNIENTKKIIEDSRLEIVAVARQSAEAKSVTNSANSKLSELEKHSLVLAKLKHQEECVTMKLDHSILKVRDDTRQILKDRIAAEKAALYAQHEALASPPAKIKRKIIAPKQPENPNANVMAKLEAELLATVHDAAVEFIETVPASRPPSPKSDDQIKEQHTVFETCKGFFTDRVEVAETKFLMAMEEIEYGQAKTKLGQTKAKMLAAAEKARLAAKALANQLAENAKKAQEEAARLQAELDKLRAVGPGDKRWKSEKVDIMIGDDHLEPKDYKFQVLDKGTEINIDVNISQSRIPSPSASPEETVIAKAKAKAEEEAKRLNEAKAKAEEEAKRLNEAKAKAEEEAKRLNEEMKKAEEEVKRLNEGMKKAEEEAKRLNEEMKKAEEEAKRLNEAMKKAQSEAEAEAKCLNEVVIKAQDEAKHLSEEMKKAQEERDRLAAELAKLQAMGSGGKRWKSEIVSIVMDNKELSKEEYKIVVLDKGAQIDIDVQIEGISNKIETELEAVKKNLLNDESSALIKTSIEEVLQHLENIADIIKPKSKKAGPSKNNVDNNG